MTHPLQLVLAAQAWREIETYYDHGRRHPTVNVKLHVFGDNDIPWDDLRGEFDDETVDTVKAWVEALYDAGEYDQIEAGLDIAREIAWQDAQEYAEELLPGNPKVYSAGRSGGHLIVDNIGSPDDWFSEECEHTLDTGDYCYEDDCDGFEVPDLERVYAWYTFVSEVLALRDNIPYSTGWHLIVNVHEPIHDLQGVI